MHVAPKCRMSRARTEKHSSCTSHDKPATAKRTVGGISVRLQVTYLPSATLLDNLAELFHAAIPDGILLELDAAHCLPFGYVLCCRDTLDLTQHGRPVGAEVLALPRGPGPSRTLPAVQQQRGPAVEAPTVTLHLHAELQEQTHHHRRSSQLARTLLRNTSYQS